LVYDTSPEKKVSNMEIVLVTIFGILYAATAWWKLRWAVALFLAALPAYQIRFEVLGVPSTLLELMILIAFAVWLLRFTNFIPFITGKYKVKDYLANRKDRLRYPFDWELAAWIIIGFVAAGLSGFSADALGIWKAYFFEPALVFILVLNVFQYNANAANGYANGANRKRDDANGAEAAAGKNAANTDQNVSLRRAERCGNPVTVADVSGLPRFARNDSDESLVDFVGKITWPLAVSAFLVSLIAIIEKFTGLFAVEHFWPRVTGPFGYPNALGLYLGPIVVLLVGWFLNNVYTRDKHLKNPKSEIPNPRQISNLKSQISKLFFIITIIAIFATIFFARSEGALIGVAAGLVLIGLLAGRRARWATLLIIVVGTAGLVSFAPTRQKVMEKATLSDLSGEIRKQQWRETWQMYRDNPEMFLLGTGLAGYQEAIKPYHQPGIFYNFERDPDFRRKIVIFDDKYRAEHWQPVEVYLYPHNIILNFWTELGLLGMLLFVWMVVKFYVMGMKVLSFRGAQATKESRFTGDGAESTRSPRSLPVARDDKGEKLIVLGLMGVMAVMLVHGLVDVPYFKNDLAVLFWVIMAMMGASQLTQYATHNT